MSRPTFVVRSPDDGRPTISLAAAADDRGELVTPLFELAHVRFDRGETFVQFPLVDLLAYGLDFGRQIVEFPVDTVDATLDVVEAVR